MTRLVDRFGRTGLAALTSLAWAIPMAAWAASADLSPIDQTAYPRIALGIGAVMLTAWLILVAQLRKVQLAPKPHRLDLRHMSGPEKRWMLAFGAFCTAIIAWLNTAATVDLRPLVKAVAARQAGATVFAALAGGFLIAMLAGAAISWRRAARAFEARRTRPPSG